MANQIEVKVPDLGDFKDIPVIEVLVSPGDAIDKEASLITLETDKATMEVPSPAAGTVKALKVKVGDKVSAGSLILMLETSEVAEEKVSAPAAKTPAPAAPASQPAAPAPHRSARRLPRHRRPLLPASRPTSMPKSWCWAPAPAATPRHSALPISAKRWY